MPGLATVPPLRRLQRLPRNARHVHRIEAVFSNAGLDALEALQEIVECHACLSRPARLSTSRQGYRWVDGASGCLPAVSHIIPSRSLRMRGYSGRGVRGFGFFSAVMHRRETGKHGRLNKDRIAR